MWGLRNIIKSGNTYEGWDEYYYEWSAGWGSAVRYVTSINGIDWTVVNQPALIGAGSISVVKEGNTYQMWQHPAADASFYSGSWALRYRTSNAGGNGWGDWQTEGVVITVDGNNTITLKNRIRRLPVGIYQLFYSDGDYINLATSTNGISFTTQISELINITHTLPITSIYMDDFDVVDMGGADWFYFTYCSALLPSGYCGSSHIAVSQPIHHNYLPVVLSNPSGFPLFVGNAIPKRPAQFKGEIFYSQLLQIPAQLPSGGHFYFAAQPNAVGQVLVDDQISIISNGVTIFSYDFSQNGSPQLATIEVPQAVMQQIAGTTVTIQYKDLYGSSVQATSMWLIWVP